MLGSLIPWDFFTLGIAPKGQELIACVLSALFLLDPFSIELYFFSV